MSTVRWVEPGFLLTEADKAKYTSARRRRDMIAVIPLAGLKGVVEGLRHTTVCLVAAVSMLERGGKTRKTIKKVVASDTMFDQMLVDYNKGIAEAQRLLAQLAPEGA